MKYWLAILSLIAVGVTLAMVDVAFIGALGYPFRLISMVLIVSLYASILIRDLVGFLVFCAGSLVASLAASTLLILPILAGCTVLLLVSRLVERLFTNRNYYSVLAVASIGWAVYQLLLSGIANMLLRLIPKTSPTVFPTALELAVSWVTLAVLLTIGYATTVVFSKKIRSYFIVGSSSV